MATVISNHVLINGLRTEFADTYLAVRNRQADGRLGQVMDLSVSATNRQHDFAYFQAAPHMAYWQRGDTVPTDAFDSVSFRVPVYEWARRVPWSKFDRKDDQTGTLMDMARMAGESAALLPERFFFNLIQNSAADLPAVPNAPDGLDMYSTSATRFHASTNGGNQITGTGVATTSAILADYYNAMERLMGFQDGKGQPLFSPEVVSAGSIIIFPHTETEAFEEAFLQRRQGTFVGSDAGVTPSNIIQDASRNVQLWPTPRLTADANDWFLFLSNPPKKPTFLLDREGLQEFTSLEGDNNGDHTRNTGEEYIQWEVRQGAGIALPYATIKVSNS
jgi:hypothetical protein